MSIKTAAIFFKGNWQTVTKTKEVAEISPSIIVFIPKESEMNTISLLPYCAKKLDGVEMRTILLNGQKVIPSDRMPNISEVNVYTCFL